MRGETEEKVMRRIHWLCETGFAGERHEGKIDVEDNATDEEIEEIVREEVFNYISWGWEEMELD